MKGIALVSILCWALSPTIQGQSGDSQQLLVAIQQLQESLTAQSQIHDTAWCRKIEADIAFLKLAALRSGEAGKQPLVTTDQWLSLVTEVSALKADNEQLRAMVKGQSTQLVSIGDDEPLVSGAGALHERLAALAGQIEELLQRQPRPAPVEQNGPEGLKWSGFVDGSGYANHNTHTSSFGLDQVEVDLQNALSDHALVRADIEGLNDGAGGVNLGVEQAFMSWKIDGRWKTQFTFGKFNAPIGFEALDPVSMYQYSRAFVGTYCAPTNLTGILFTVSAPRVLDWSVYLVNGWDVNSDNNKGKTIGTRLGLRARANLTFGLSAITGPELADNTASHRSVLDADLTYNPTNWWLIGAEANIGWETRVVNNETATWQGFLLMSNVKFLGRCGLTARGDYLRDGEGDRTGTAQELKAVCLSPSISVADGLTALLEVRHEWSNRNVFATVASTNSNQTTTACEFTYAF